MANGYVTRTESFSAAHRLHNPCLSEEENRALYGKCNNPNGHGHNYKVEVTVFGEINPATGMIVDLGKLKELIWSEALHHLDHKHLDMDVDYFCLARSTAENIAVFFWECLEEPVSRMSPTARLHSIRLHETEHNIAEYRGE